MRGLAGAIGLALVIYAWGPPPDGPEEFPPDELEPARPPAPTRPQPPERAFALSVQTIGPAKGRARLQDELAPAVAVPPMVDDPKVPGELVGVVEDRAAAMRWLAEVVFDRALGFSPALRDRPAPSPGGRAYDEYDVVLASIYITELDGSGEPKRRAWPRDRRALVPEGSAWRTASLISSHAPLFAAPAAALPAADEAHALVHRQGDLFVLGEVDRCDTSPARRCLRWLQVVGREEDRFVAGYLPAFMVTLDRAWVRAEGGLPRAQLIPSAVTGQRATFVVVARGLDGHLRRRTLTAPLSNEEDAFPDGTTTIEGESVVLSIQGQPTIHLEVAALDDLSPPEPELLTTP